MKRDYTIHEEIYKSRKSKGFIGWQDEKGLVQTLALLNEDFKSQHAPKCGRAIELGCGAGDLTIWLAKKGFEAHGIDISPTAISWAAEKTADRGVIAKYKLGSVLTLESYADDDFDFALDGYCLHCIIAEDRTKLLSSVRRVLKTGGILHVRTMCAELGERRMNLTPELRARFNPSTRYVCDEDGIATRYIGKPDDILREIRASGFHVLEWKVIRSTGEPNQLDVLVVWAQAIPGC